MVVIFFIACLLGMGMGGLDWSRLFFFFLSKKRQRFLVDESADYKEVPKKWPEDSSNNLVLESHEIRRETSHEDQTNWPTEGGLTKDVDCKVSLGDFFFSSPHHSCLWKPNTETSIFFGGQLEWLKFHAVTFSKHTVDGKKTLHQLIW